MKRSIISVFISFCFVFTGLYYAESQPEEKEYQINLPGGRTVRYYQLISFPVKPIDDQDPWTNEDILIDDLGQYDPYQWRFFRWDPVEEDYVELNQRDNWGADQNLDFGRGYWIISVQTKTASVSGITDVSSKTILLYSGWNQIGNPFYDIRADLKVGPVGGELVPLTDDLNVYTHRYVWEWVEGNYQITTDPLEAGKGYWIKNITEGPVELQFVPSQVPVGEGKSFSKDTMFDLEQSEGPPSPPSAVETSSSVSLSGGSGGGGGGGCFIATAAYGNYDDPGVQLLRDFRDRYLLKNRFGRFFVDTYYRYSPGLAGLVAKHKPIGVLARCNLMPLIGVSAVVSKMNAYAFLVLIGFLLLAGLFSVKRTKGAWGRCKPKLSRELKERKREK
jgi:hypothetical protein